MTTEWEYADDHVKRWVEDCPEADRCEVYGSTLAVFGPESECYDLERGMIEARMRAAEQAEEMKRFFRESEFYDLDGTRRCPRPEKKPRRRSIR